MEKITLQAEKREISKRGAELLRKEGFVPAILYGSNTDPLALKVGYNEFRKVFEKAGRSSIITVVIGDDERNIIIQDVQYDSVKGDYLHIDMHQIRMDEKINAEIDVIIEGESPAVKEQGGILVSNLSKIEIQCLPGDLIHDIKIDISKLSNLNDSIHVEDIDFPENIEVLTPKEESIVFVEEPRSEAELEELDEEVTEDVESVEGVADKDEDEESAEGESSEDKGADESAEAKEDKKEE